ncbi:MAG: FG-GAP-like repeat-containing protein, partial [Planctomycetota bacterium]
MLRIWHDEESAVCAPYPDGTVWGMPRFAGLSNPSALESADFDGDGQADLVIATRGDDSITWFRRDGCFPNGEPRFSKARVLADNLRAAKDVRTADLTGNGRPDVVACGADEARVLFFENRNDGDFAAAKVIDQTLKGDKILDLIDMDRDGRLDVIVASTGGVLWRRNVGGDFGPAQNVGPLAAARWTRPVPTTLAVYDAESLKVDKRLTSLSDFAGPAALSPDGRCLAAYNGESAVHVWALAEGEVIHTIATGGDVAIRDLIYTPDGRLLLAAVGDDLLIWSGDDCVMQWELKEHDNTVRRIAVSPDSRTAASVSDDMSVRLWSLLDGRQLRVLTGHRSSPCAAAFSHDGRRLATGASDGTVRIWDVVTGQQLLVL